jgi:CRP-like cAMP-binding protein
MMSAQPRPHVKNHILDSLPREDYERLLPHLETLEMSQSQILYKAQEVMEHVYFPHNSMVSLISRTPEGESVEVGMVGFEGIAGISTVLGVDNSPYEIMVQIPGDVTQMRVGVLREEFKRSGAMQSLLLRYTQGLLLQTSQIAACNRLHTLLERLARWLLMSQDRCMCDDLPFTQEFLSLMLGVRRAGVTEAAIILQAEGFIKYSRGHIEIIDRAGLKCHSCECYEVVKEEFDQLIGADSANSSPH